MVGGRWIYCGLAKVVSISSIRWAEVGFAEFGQIVGSQGPGSVLR